MNNMMNVGRIIVVGDAYVSPTTLVEAAQKLDFPQAEIIPLMWGTEDKNDFTDAVTLIERGGAEAAAYPAELDDLIAEADVLLVHFCPLPRALLQKAGRLKLVGTCRGGTEHICVDLLNEKKIPLIHIIRNAEAVAEFTVGMMLAETRNIARSHHLLMQGQWPTDFPNTEFTSTLKNLTVGLAGLGNIGALVAQKLNALGVQVLGYDAYMDPSSMKRLPITPVSHMDTLFETADIVSLHLRLTESNRGIINAELLGKMKPTAYLINASRGGLIDEKALCQALAEHRLAGAALDVFIDEPLAQDSPLLKLDNVTLTPHLAGDTVDAIARSPFLLVSCIREYLTQGNTTRVFNKNSIF